MTLSSFLGIQILPRDRKFLLKTSRDFSYRPPAQTWVGWYLSRTQHWGATRLISQTAPSWSQRRNLRKYFSIISTLSINLKSDWRTFPSYSKSGTTWDKTVWSFRSSRSWTHCGNRMVREEDQNYSHAQIWPQFRKVKLDDWMLLVVVGIRTWDETI